MSDTAIAELQTAADRLFAEQEAAKVLGELKGRLVLSNGASNAFFATIALGWNCKPTWEIPTMATDGKNLVYNPEFLRGLTPANAQGVLVHEALHVALMHPFRRGHRDPKQWNIAIDLASNSILRKAGYSLPASGVFNDKPPYNFPPDLTAEDYYELLCKNKPPEPEGDGDGDGQGQDPGGCGGVKDPGDGSQSAAGEAEAQAKQRVVQAAQAAQSRSKGDLPAALQKLIDEITKPKVNWRDVLREFMQRPAKSELSWSRPNQRYLHRGLYLPSRRGRVVGHVVIALDESGSISDEQLKEFAGEVEGILDGHVCQVTILHHDVEVHHVQEWKPSDGPLTLERRCCGGTSHFPVFQWVHDNLEEEPAVFVGLTDLYSSFPEQPAYPVLWCVNGNPKGVGPWGETIHLKD